MLRFYNIPFTGNTKCHSNISTTFIPIYRLDYTFHFYKIAICSISQWIYLYLPESCLYTFRVIYIPMHTYFPFRFYTIFIFLQNYINIQRFSGEKNNFSSIILLFFLLMRVFFLLRGKYLNNNGHIHRLR